MYVCMHMYIHMYVLYVHIHTYNVTCMYVYAFQINIVLLGTTLHKYHRYPTIHVHVCGTYTCTYTYSMYLGHMMKHTTCYSSTVPSQTNLTQNLDRISTILTRF